MISIPYQTIKMQIFRNEWFKIYIRKQIMAESSSNQIESTDMRCSEI